MNKKIKYFYFFRGTLATHVHFYKCWVDAARRNGIPMEIVTFLDSKTYNSQYGLVKKYRTNYFHIFCGITDKIIPAVIFLYFFMQCLLNDRVVVYLKKRTSDVFDRLKKIFPGKLKYIIDLEGDPASEKDYLLGHPYKEGFYNEEIINMDAAGRRLEKELKNCDLVFVVTDKFRKTLIGRYPDLDLENKIGVLPISFDENAVYFSPEARNKYRSKLGLSDKFVVTYIGNAYYSWQNVYRTIEIFKLLKGDMSANAFLLLLIRKEDHNIVNEFIHRIGISKDEYLLTFVDHDEIGGYLSASDAGIALRHWHQMNDLVTSGKIVEYLAAGLPVIITKAFANYPEEIAKNNYGMILDDMDNDAEILRKIVPFLKYDEGKRIEMSGWAKRKFSTDAIFPEKMRYFKGLSE